MNFHTYKTSLKRWQNRLSLPLVLIVLDALAVLLSLVFSQPDGISFGFGLSFLLMGNALRIWTKGYGRSANTLLMSGPYAFVRHPYFLGHWLCIIGSIVAGRNAWVFMGYIICSSFLLMRLVHQKDISLGQRFPEIYGEYRKSVSGFFPQLLSGTKQWTKINQPFSLTHAFKADDYQELYVLGAYLFLFGFYAYDMVYDVKFFIRTIFGLACAAAVSYVLWRRLKVRSFATNEA